MRRALAVVGAIAAGLAAVSLFALALLLVLGHALAEETFDAEFYLAPIALVSIGVGLVIVASRLGARR